MKRPVALFLTILMSFSLAACGETNADFQSDDQGRVDRSPQAATAPGREYDETDPAAVLEEITDDFADDTTAMTPESEETTTAVKDTVSENEKGGNAGNETKEPVQSDSSADAAKGIRPEFQDAMDSYEAFYCEYCKLMKEYSQNPTDLTLLAKYADMLVKAEEMNEAFEAWDGDTLSTEELKYYLDVHNRVMKMLVDVAG